MKTISIILCIVGLLISLTNAGVAQFLLVESTLHIDTVATFDSVRVVFGGTLIADNSITVLGNMLIESGGKLTHSVHDTAGLRLNVVGTLDVQANGSIDVSGKGLYGGRNGSMYGEHGETMGATDEIVSAGNGSSRWPGGASYGGYGGTGAYGGVNIPYGILENPHYLGAGGGGAYGGIGSQPQVGGNGGGRATLTAPTVIVNGSIRANGQIGVTSSGGSGSGGSIIINAETLSGSGTIEARGANAGSHDVGAGGGGRIAITYTAMTLPTDSIFANSGSGSRTGSAGTIYLKDNANTNGDLIVSNGSIANAIYTPLKTNLSTLRSISLLANVQLQLFASDVDSITVEQPVSLLSSTVLWVGAGVTLNSSNVSGYDISVGSGSLLMLDTNSVFTPNALQINGGTVKSNINQTYLDGSNFEITNGGVLNMLSNSILNVGTFDTSNLKSGEINIPKGCTLNISSNSVTIGSGFTLTKSGTFGTNDSINSITILSGGILTHSVHDTAGLRLNVVGTLDVQANGSIDVSGKGLYGGRNGSMYGEHGETIDANDEIVSAGNGTERWPGGASYGGYGGNGAVGISNSPYGTLENPHSLGAGGGGAYGGIGSVPQVGGNGGGRATIIAGTLIVDGSIQANGQTGSCCYGSVAGGGGAGGSVLLNVVSLSGMGKIEAIGANAGSRDVGAGGGGRIAVTYTTMTLPTDSILVNSGSGSRTGSAGTIYLKDNANSYGDLIVDNRNVNSNLPTPHRSSLTRFRKIIIVNQVKLEISSEVEIEGEIIVSSGGQIGRP